MNGILKVTSNPRGAYISIGGVRKGQTPFAGQGYLVGSQQYVHFYYPTINDNRGHYWAAIADAHIYHMHAEILPVSPYTTTVTVTDEGPTRGAIIEAIEATPVDVQCQEPCDAVIDITWKNTGDQDGNFTPAIMVSNVRIAPYLTQSLVVGATVKKRFTLTGLTVGTYYVNSDPGGMMVPITVAGIGEPICTPDWICESPLNGYENNQCGHRRLSPACNPIEPPIEKDNTGLLLIGVGLVGIILLSKKIK